MIRRALIMATLLVAACGEEDVDVAAPAAKSGKAKGAAKEAGKDAAPTLDEQLRTYSYSPVGKRDPFQSYLVELQSSGDRLAQRRREATETYELDQYRLTWVVTGTSSPKAMVEDPDGLGHSVGIGSRLGKNGGLVTRISNEGIVVTEELRAPTGERVRVPITVPLPQSELGIGESE